MKTHQVITEYNYVPDDGIPANLSYGFAASTGSSTNFHEIRNIQIIASAAVKPNAVKVIAKTISKNATQTFAGADYYNTDIDISRFVDPNLDALARK